MYNMHSNNYLKSSSEINREKFNNKNNNYYYNKPKVFIICVIFVCSFYVFLPSSLLSTLTWSNKLNILNPDGDESSCKNYFLKSLNERSTVCPRSKIFPIFFGFDDEDFTSKHGIKLSLEKGKKYENNPIILPDTKAEEDLLVLGGTVRYNEARKKFRMWYQGVAKVSKNIWAIYLLILIVHKLSNLFFYIILLFKK